MKLTKLVWHFSDFSMIFSEFCNIFVFIEKEKNKRKEKRLAWAWSSPQRSWPNCKDSVQVEREKKAHQKRATRIGTFCIRNSDLFQKLLRPSHFFFLSGVFTCETPYFFRQFYGNLEGTQSARPSRSWEGWTKKPEILAF